MQRPLWISAPLLWISASAITDAYTVNTFSASYLDAATEAMNPIPYEETQKNRAQSNHQESFHFQNVKLSSCFFNFNTPVNVIYTPMPLPIDLENTFLTQRDG